MSIQFFEKALATLKKANKVRREKLASEAGYANSELYKEFLEGMIGSPSHTVSEMKKEPSKAKEKAKKKEKPKAEVVPEPAEELTDLVIAFDTTGSMRSYIGNVKSHVKALIPNLFKENPNMKVSIVAFGDYYDMLGKDRFGDAYQVIDLTNDENALIDFVSKAKDTNGKDSDEFYELVIKKITEETAWREGSNKSVLFIADAEPHRVGYSFSDYVINNQIDWREEAKKAAQAGIKFDTLRISTHNWYKELSKITGGVCLDFQSSSKSAQLVEATVLARGGKATMDAFMSKSVQVAASSDTEMKAVYSMYKTVINK